MKKFHKKSLVLLVCVAMLLTFTVSGTVAFLADNSGSVTNTFTPVKVDTYIDETENGVSGVKVGEKSVIKVVNKSGTEYIPVYVRVALAGNWVKMVEGKEVIVAPATAAEMTFTLGSDWIKHTDGFYYYTKVVNPGKSTSDLLGTPITGATKDDGSYLVVTVVHQAIQTEPAQALTDANWGWTPSTETN